METTLLGAVLLVAACGLSYRIVQRLRRRRALMQREILMAPVVCRRCGARN